MADKWIVLKFGGTSVAGRPQWDVIASLARSRHEQGYRVLLVCSAVAGVTDRLEALAGGSGSAALMTGLLDAHRRLGRDLGVDDDCWLPEATTLFEKCLGSIRSAAEPRERAVLLAMGEWLSTRIGVEFLGRHVETGWVDAREALTITPEPELSAARQWLAASCPAVIDQRLQRRWSAREPVLITQGFVAATADGATALLGRGGSDTSAALLAGRLAADCVEIWTDVPGLFSADPRLISQARLLAEVDYAEALEIAASGARVVHPRCIRAAAETATPLVVRDLGRPGLSGTRISDRGADATGVKTVTCQPDMAVLLLQNLDMRQQVGFLAGIFEVFRGRGLSVDLVATSETTTTLSINRASNHLDDGGLEALVADLQALARVELFADCVCINLVGRGARTALARLADVMRLFDERPLLMVSQSANDLCLSLLVLPGDREALLHGAHAAIVPSAEQASDVFGPTWDEIRRGP